MLVRLVRPPVASLARRGRPNRRGSPGREVWARQAEPRRTQAVRAPALLAARPQLAVRQGTTRQSPAARPGPASAVWQPGARPQLEQQELAQRRPPSALP